jgi:NADP-dependent 3-hydroxy acid dehydrogenase YdfG
MPNSPSPHNCPRVWLITGCTSSFGKLFVSAIVARGDKVIATARNVSALDEFKDKPNVRLLSLDVTATQDELNAKSATALKLFGGVDVLVNNAGYVLSGAWEELT